MLRPNYSCSLPMLAFHSPWWAQCGNFACPSAAQPRWSISGGGPCDNEAVKSVVEKWKRPPCRGDRAHGGPKAADARAPLRRGLGGPKGWRPLL